MKKRFSTFQKFFLAIFIFGAIGAATMFIGGVAGSTNFATTILPPRLSASPDSGLIAHWTFDGTDMPSGQVNDQSNSGYNSSLVNMSTSSAYTVGPIGQALNFDGVDDYVKVGPSTNLSRNISASTIVAWVKNTGPGTGNGSNIVQITISGGANVRQNLTFGQSAGSVGCDTRAPDNQASASGVTATVTLNKNEWYHIVCTNDIANDTGYIWINGVPQTVTSDASYTNTTYDDTAPLTVQIGRSSNATNAFQGAIDDVRIYNRILNLDEVKQLYQLGATTKVDTTQLPPRLAQSANSGLVGHWTFDGKDMPSGQVNDMSGQGNNGSQRNMATSSAFVPGSIGQALKFDGTDDRVAVGDVDTIDSSTQLSGCAWTKHSTVTSDDELIAKYSSGTDDGFLFFRDDVSSVSARTDIYSIYIADSADADTARLETASDVGIAGEWKFVCFTFVASSATGLRLYVNGVEVPDSAVSTASIGAINAGTAALVVGATSDATNQLDGIIDDVRIYNRALSPDEIKQLYQLGATAKMATTQAPPRLAQSNESGLVGHWTFDGKDMPSGQVSDMSGQANHASKVNMATSSAYGFGVLGQALELDGVNDYVDVPNRAGLDITGTTITVSGWFNNDTLTSGFHRIISMPALEGAGSEKYTLLLDGTNSKIDFFIGGSGGGADQAASTTFSGKGTWHHVVGTYSSPTMKLYVDGVLQQTYTHSIPGTGIIANSSGNLQIGRFGPTFGQYFDGKVDDIRVYNRTLSDDEVKQLYQMGK